MFHRQVAGPCAGLRHVKVKDAKYQAMVDDPIVASQVKKGTRQQAPVQLAACIKIFSHLGDSALVGMASRAIQVITIAYYTYTGP